MANALPELTPEKLLEGASQLRRLTRALTGKVITEEEAVALLKASHEKLSDAVAQEIVEGVQPE